MDWARDNAGLGDRDLRNVLRYEPKTTTVIKAVESNGYQAQIWALSSDRDWFNWIENEVQPMSDSERGFILVISKRKGEPALEYSGSRSIQEWLDLAESTMPRPPKAERKFTAVGLVEKEKNIGSGVSDAESGGSSDLRTLSFSLETYQALTECFRTHGSIARAISRADIPLFSSESAVMGDAAYVYNCRTSHAWAGDLALSSTYLLRMGLSCSILYGCPFANEETIIKRLGHISYEASHPLLLPGILTEIELARHTRLVSSMTTMVENKIFQLDSAYETLGRSRAETEERNEAKRDAWLDLSYLRNGLVGWNTQIGRMMEHLSELEEKVFVPKAKTVSVTSDWTEVGFVAGNLLEKDKPKAGSEPQKQPFLSQIDVKPGKRASHDSHVKSMQDVGRKIRTRLTAIRDEYDDKIRDCTMRLDGMAMATQWSHGETNVEIALATNRDSQVMRSIALVTMLFLPGTFFATIFSMTFFQWSGDNGAHVSGYLWIYVLITAVFTAATVGLWYYFVMMRKNRGLDADSGV